MNHLIDKRIIIGINFFDSKDNLIDQYQTSGIITSIQKDFISIKRDGLPNFQIPYDERAIQLAAPGIYRERNTGKEIENPDFIAQWSVKSTSEINIEEYTLYGFKPK